MKNSILITGASIVNEGRLFIADVLVEDGFITEIGSTISKTADEVIDGTGKYLLPGLIDTHVHFREPGLTQKGEIGTESAAAVAGGVTSYFDMPNTIPNTTSIEAIEARCRIAEANSYANYAFYLGATQDTINLIPELEKNDVCGLTDDGLYFTNAKSLLVDQPDLFRELLNKSPKVISIHSEDESQIEKNLQEASLAYGDNIPPYLHPVIRSEEACFNATKRALEIASQTSGRLHILHLSTAREAALFESNPDPTQKKITSEVCVHHLWFSDRDYQKLGNKIKWNPAIKTQKNRDGLLQAVVEDRIDIISTDHAPHLKSEKERPYKEAPSGAPMVQHSLLVMLELARLGKITINKIVEKMCHNPARLFSISKRGFIRIGYHADLVLVDLENPTPVTESGLFYKCKWSPLEGNLSSSIYFTLVNGVVSYKEGRICAKPAGQKLSFEYSNNK